MNNPEKDKLVEELNRLSEWRPWTKDRMIEIARILLKDYYWYLSRNRDEWLKSDLDSQRDDEKNI
jgi:hypothetical protein